MVDDATPAVVVIGGFIEAPVLGLLEGGLRARDHDCLDDCLDGGGQQLRVGDVGPGDTVEE